MSEQGRNLPNHSKLAPEYQPTSLQNQLVTNDAINHSHIDCKIPTSVSTAAFTPTEADFDVLLGPWKDQPKESKPLNAAKMDSSPVDAKQQSAGIIPTGIVFTNEKDDDLMCISKTLLKKLPMPVLDKLMKLSKQSLGGTYYLGATLHYESLVRLEQYLQNGDYTPFNPTIPLQYVDISGTARVWTRKQQNHAIKVTEETARLFRSEVHLYLFAAEFGFASLRELSAKRLELEYPPSLKGIFRLVSSVYNVAAKNKDLGLGRHILELLEANSGDLAQMPDFITLIKDLFIKNDPFSMVLVETLSRAYRAAKTELNQQSLKPVTKSQSTPPQQLPANTPIGPAKYQLEVEASHTLELFAKLVEKGCLVVALGSGYGTLLRGGEFEGRNRDFVFKAGEFLLIDREESQTSKHNVSVINSRGERGDILRKMVDRVSTSLGAIGIKEGMTSFFFFRVGQILDMPTVQLLRCFSSAAKKLNY